MALLNRPINELDLVAFLLLSLLSLLLLFDRDFAILYIVMIVIWFFLYFKDRLFGNKTISYPVEQNPATRWTEVIVGLVAFVVLRFGTNFILNMVKPGAVDALVTLKQALQATVPLPYQNNLLIMFVGLSVMIPVIETSLAGKVFEFLSDLVNRKTIVSILVICAMIGAGFAGLHIAAYSTDPSMLNESLIASFIFFTATAFIIWWRKSLIAAIVLHMIWNFMAVGLPLLMQWLATAGLIH